MGIAETTVKIHVQHIHVFDPCSGSFVPASDAEHTGTGPFDHAPVDDGSGTRIFNEIDETPGPAPRGEAKV